MKLKKRIEFNGKKARSKPEKYRLKNDCEKARICFNEAEDLYQIRAKIKHGFDVRSTVKMTRLKPAKNRLKNSVKIYDFGKRKQS